MIALELTFSATSTVVLALLSTTPANVTIFAVALVSGATRRLPA